MKKLFAFLLLLCCLASTAWIKAEKNPLFALDGVQKVCFVSNEKYDNLESVNCGNLVFNFCSLEIAQKNLQEFSNKAEGVQFYFDSVSAQDILTKLKAEVVSTSTNNGICVTVAYTPFFQDCIFVEGKKANLQLAQQNGKLIAGLPAILTGF